uniref:Uncharacterized protein n=1 Tax=Anguilla anguilla TaxID=7936 RepID=A0A0E9XG20_ANGAN
MFQMCRFLLENCFRPEQLFVCQGLCSARRYYVRKIL